MHGRVRDNGSGLTVLIAALVAALAAAAALVVIGASTTASSSVTPAYADATAARGRTYVVRQRIRFADIICIKKRAQREQPGKCRGVAKLRTTAAYRDANPARTARGDQGWCRDWKFTMRGLYYVNWKEEARGRFCWIEGPSAPDIYDHTWECGFSSAIGYDVHPEDCWDRRRTGDTTYGWWLSVYDKFRVTAAFRGFPIHWTYQFHVNLHPTGTVKAYVD